MATLTKPVDPGPVVGTTAAHLWPAQGKPFSLESWEEYADGSTHQVIVTFDGEVITTYRDAMECPNGISMFDHSMTPEQVKEQYDKAKATRPATTRVSKDQILNRFLQ